MPKTYFISDTHFGHKNILKYEPCRVQALTKYLIKKRKGNVEEEYDTLLEELTNRVNNAQSAEDIKDILEEHDNMIVDNWNAVVKPDDIVWFLGDFALGSRNKVLPYIGRLKGHKRMIKGNHDNLPSSFYRENGFEYVSKYPIIVKDFFVLSHAPLEYMNDQMPFFNIYGHVHSHPSYVTKSNHSQCVCVERQDFKPIEIEEFNNYQPKPLTNPAEELRSNNG